VSDNTDILISLLIVAVVFATIGVVKLVSADKVELEVVDDTQVILGAIAELEAKIEKLCAELEAHNAKPYWWEGE